MLLYLDKWLVDRNRFLDKRERERKKLEILRSIIDNVPVYALSQRQNKRSTVGDRIVGLFQRG